MPAGGCGCVVGFASLGNRVEKNIEQVPVIPELAETLWLATLHLSGLVL